MGNPNNGVWERLVVVLVFCVFFFLLIPFFMGGDFEVIYAAFFVAIFDVYAYLALFVLLSVCGFVVRRLNVGSWFLMLLFGLVSFIQYVRVSLIQLMDGNCGDVFSSPLCESPFGKVVYSFFSATFVLLFFSAGFYLRVGSKKK